MVRRFENFHIFLWLLKDSAWLLEWKLFGVLMVIPTVLVAVQIAYIAYKRQDAEYLLQTAVVMWICANSYWMCCEFFNGLAIKNFAIIPFAVGLFLVCRYYYPLVAKRLSCK